MQRHILRKKIMIKHSTIHCGNGVCWYALQQYCNNILTVRHITVWYIRILVYFDYLSNSTHDFGWISKFVKRRFLILYKLKLTSYLVPNTSKYVLYFTLHWLVLIRMCYRLIFIPGNTKSLISVAHVLLLK